MTVIHRSSIVQYQPQQMFVLVDDIDAYPKFLPWCKSTKVLHREQGQVSARIEVAHGPIGNAFTTRNKLNPWEQIDLELVEGPFKFLRGKWRFEALGDGGCKISLDLAFEFSSFLMGKVAGPVFNKIANAMVDAFCQRAKQVYG